MDVKSESTEASATSTALTRVSSRVNRTWGSVSAARLVTMVTGVNMCASTAIATRVNRLLACVPAAV